MSQQSNLQKFGTAPVFFTAISTILGAIMFLRFGFAVGHVGFIGTIAIILIGHAVTIPTAMAIAEIATNQKVEGGGEYYIISRSFGLVIGSAIGLALFMSQAISVAFYIMAFTEAFTPLINYLNNNFALPEWLSFILAQKQTIGIPALLLLTYIMLTKGADLGVKMLYGVVATLAIAMIAFFVGNTEYAKEHKFDPYSTIANHNDIEETTPVIKENNEKIAPKENFNFGFDSLFIIPMQPKVSVETSPVTKKEDNTPKEPLITLGFFTVFAIIFPAFTGMTAGVGLSGDLKNPGKSIPLGTLAATIVGMIVYVLIAFKLAQSADPITLADTSGMVMSSIAWQGWWLIPVGLAAATISSALGSIMVAPRTLQAIAKDNIFPTPRVNNWISKGKGEKEEPFNASVVTILIAAGFILAGALDMVAQIISMFFMVTYGSLCLISFLNHFAADPSYRPKFKSRWYFSLFGAIACFGLMFLMNGTYAIMAIILMGVLYFIISYYNQDKKSMALIFQGVIFQFSRSMQVFLQKADKEKAKSWRPSAIAFSSKTFERLGLLDLLGWISQKYGFGTYIHHVEGYLSKETHAIACNYKDRLIKMSELAENKIYIDTLISPSFTSSIAQVVQLPGIAGTENNLLMFEFSKDDPESLMTIVDNFKLIKSVDFDILILGTSQRGFGLKRRIDIWITSSDYHNANLMILLSYIMIGHKNWKGAEIKIFAIYPKESIDIEKVKLFDLIEIGQLPISPNNIEFITREPDISTGAVISEKSKDTDLTILGFYPEKVKHQGVNFTKQLEEIGNVLLVHAAESKQIK